MKKTGIILTIVSSIVLIISITSSIIGSYKLERDYISHWNLSDKSSTIEAKSYHIDNFVNSLSNDNFEGKHNAIILKTLDNSFDENFKALKTLQQRLYEILEMDVKTFEYQTAIQQITSQEQGEAQHMMRVIKGIWWKENYWYLWNWIGGVQITLFSIMFVVGLFCWIEDYL